MFGSIKVRNILVIMLGAAIMSFGLVYFNMQNNLADGGFTGITLILYFMFNINPAYSNLILNIPLFIIGWKVLGKNAFIYTIIGTVSVSLFLWIFQYYPVVYVPLYDDLTLAALFAGAFIGAGLGIVFRVGGTTGGVDIIAKLGFKYFGWSMGRTMFVFDAIVITSSLVYLNYREAMYTLLAVFVAAKVIDLIQQGAYSGKAAMIISDHTTEIAASILKQMDRGATILKGKGTFTGVEREVLYCVVGKNEVVRLKSLIAKVDPHAFVTLGDVQDVMGEGFTFDENKRPFED
ncbi:MULTISPECIES: YitT family protein [Bacillaceae]|uniref:YitT family protein n=1 Tax=Evansella alkalicola TaxID=745819 RepID=A0ABS6JZB1_9BACI|nr:MULTISPECIES: YitT family protein [Bacillaceae]MBU9723926.1 YitT family protein [Bacillus alkalicola]